MYKGICEKCGHPVIVVKCQYCKFYEYTCKNCGYDKSHCKIKESEKNE